MKGLEIGFTEMAAALAHEIKNPAAVALAHVNLLRLDTENLPHHLDHIEQALNNICELVRRMLSTTNHHSESKEVDLYTILSEILDTYRAAWPSISFTLNIAEINTLGLDDEAVLPCYGQESSLRMIFSNLLKNAVEAIEATTQTQGEIEINAKYTKDHLKITISDTPTAGNAAEMYSNLPVRHEAVSATLSSAAPAVGNADDVYVNPPVRHEAVSATLSGAGDMRVGSSSVSSTDDMYANLSSRLEAAYVVPTVHLESVPTLLNATKPHGNGLGLAICRRLANELGAQLSAVHTENGGCEVTVSLRVTRCPSIA
ncbi:MAG: sensor histidine kinase [Defluviitaleaceae bacterium]|nr:sensor histidine kinase [Defluviitaleaceae bacterium]